MFSENSEVRRGFKVVSAWVENLLPVDDLGRPEGLENRVTARRVGVRCWVLALGLAIGLAACGGSDEGAASSTEPEKLSFEETTTALPTTTTTAPTTTEKTIDPALIAPLTGLVVDSAVELDRPALVLKIDNHPSARPQSGLDQADMVFELRAEGVTRFTAVFHSKIPDPVGPVRSSRTSDFDLLSGLDRPLYGSSGGNANVMGALRSIDAISVTNQTRREYFRNGSRPAPHNLYVNATDLFALAPEDAGRPSPWFSYRAPGDELPAGAVPSDGEVTIAFTDGPTAGFTWDAASGGWPRTQNGNPHTNQDGVQLAPENVVIMVTSYSASPADASSPHLESTGSGELLVLTDGHEIAGTWERASPTDKPTLLDTAGQPIALTPGRTWVLYPEPGQISSLPHRAAGNQIDDGAPNHVE